MPILRQASETVSPLARSRSTSRSSRATSSAVRRFFMGPSWAQSSERLPFQVDQFLGSRPLIRLRLPEVLDRHLPPHPLHQGLSNGWLITAWIAYILSHADHRKSPVQAWADGLRHTLETLVGQDIRPVEFSDDRLTLVLKRL